MYRRAQEFKIEALRDLKKLFPVSTNPFYAGFGNRPSDIVSYNATGVVAAPALVNGTTEVFSWTLSSSDWTNDWATGTWSGIRTSTISVNASVRLSVEIPSLLR